MEINNDIISKTVESLRKNRISSQYIDSGLNIFSAIDTFISPGMTIGVGDSETLKQLKIYDYIKSLKVTYLDKYESSLSKEEKRNIYIINFSSDLFISGINALTVDGKIYNLDGNGSRVAPIIYGPKKVVLICGINKIVKSDIEAYERIRTKAAPVDAKRLNKKTPCVVTGKCMNCHSPDKICNYYTIIQGQFDEKRINVLIVNVNMDIKRQFQTTAST
jgi:hypothetical protein